MNNKGADQTAQMCRLVCSFGVTNQRQVFSRQGHKGYVNIAKYPRRWKISFAELFLISGSELIDAL